MNDENEPIVIDNGSGLLKAGFADDDAPKYVFPTIIGTPREPGILVGMDQKDCYIGQEALDKKGVLDLKEPIQQGIIQDIDEMEKIWLHLMNNDLRISPDSHKFFLTEPPQNPKENREELTKLFFEEFNVPKLYLGTQAVLSLFASGKTTGTVVDCGDGISHTVPIYEGYAIPHAISKINLAGRDLNQYLMTLLQVKGISFSSSSDNQSAIKKIKETCCYVAEDYDAEKKSAQEQKSNMRSYTLPSNEKISLGLEMIQCPEHLFSPGAGMNKDIDGIHKFTYDSIVKCDNDIKKDLFKGIVLAGGTTMFEGMQQRMKKEIQALAPSPM